MKRIGVVGAGLGGLVAAAAAASAGLEVDVFEAGAALADPPAHIDIVPPLMRDLVALGAGEGCVRHGFAYRGVAVVDARGQPRFQIETPALAGPRWPAALGMGYGSLLRVLHDLALARGARLHWQAAVDRCDVARAPARLHTAAGGVWQGDLVLVAGAQAVLGLTLPQARPAREWPQRWDHARLARPPFLDRTTWVVGPGRRKALLVPVGVADAGLALLRDADAPRTPGALRAHAAEQGGWLAAACATLADDAPLISRPVRSALLAGPWHEGAALCLGASAHVLPPHFGQAAAQTVEDAVVLQQLLSTRPAVDALCAGFMARRAGRARLVHAIATQAADWDLHPDPSTDLHALAGRLAPIAAQAA